MPNQLLDLPLELIVHMFEYIVCKDPLQSRFESNIHNLCSLELISKCFRTQYIESLQKYWKIILYQLIHLRWEERNGKLELNTLGMHWSKRDIVLKKLESKSYKRCFAILNEFEKKKERKKNPKYVKFGDGFKICVCGPWGSGIHSFINRYIANQFYEHYDYSCNDLFYKDVKFNDRNLRLDFWECGLRNEYYNYHESKLKNARGYILVCPLDIQSNQYEDILRIIRSIVYINDDESIPITVCINKIDLLETDPTLDVEKVKQKVIGILHDFSCTDYEIIETSCKNNTNIQTVIEKVIKNGYFFEGKDAWIRRPLIEKIIKQDAKVFNSLNNTSCLIS